MLRAAVALATLTSLVGAGELALELTPTIHCLGIRIKGVAEEVTTGKVQYRAEGEKDWKEALPLAVCLGNRFAEADETKEETQAAWTDAGPIIRRLHGSLFWLKPDTAYEVQVAMADAEGKPKGVLSGKARTLPNTVVYGQGRTLRVGANEALKTIVDGLKEAKSGDTVLVTSGVYKESAWLPKWPSGEPGNPITLRGEKGAIIDGAGVPKIADVHGGLILRDAHDLIIEGFLIRHFAYCMFINTCQRIVIQRNFIDLHESEPHAPYGIRLKRCRDCLLQFNSVQEPKLGDHDYAQYPFSIDLGRRNVIRYNQMLGGACHDIITTRANQDTDIYENVFRGLANDDGVELEGGTCINLRFFCNLLDNRNGNKGTISVTPVTVGPVFVLRNVFFCSRQVIKFANDGTANDLRAGHRFCDFAPLFFYHNLFFDPKDDFFRFLGSHGRPILLNNIAWGRALPDVTRNFHADRSTPLYARVEADHNLYWDRGRTAASPTPGLDAHSLFADPLFANPGGKGGPSPPDDFHLRPGSPALGRALRLPNINDGPSGAAPDIGCFEGSAWPGRTLAEPLKDDPR